MTRSLLWLAVAIGLTGCVSVEGFDPVGNVANLESCWTIDGFELEPELCENDANTGTGGASSLPQSACDQLGANRMRVTFLNGSLPVVHSSLFVVCDEARLVTDSSVGSGAVVAAGSWRVRLDALDSGGNIVASGPVTEHTVDEDQPLLVLPFTDFLTGQISAEYTIAGERPNADRCEEAGVTHVALEIDVPAEGAQSPSTPGLEPCAVGFVGARVLPAAGYTARLRALRVVDGAETVVVESAVSPATTIAPGGSLLLDATGPVDLRP